MRLLTDSDIVAKVAAGVFENVDVSNVDWKCSCSNIQAASLDLTIGQIVIPEKEVGQYGSLQNPVCEGNYSVTPGGTVVVRTREKLNIPGNLSGFGFPPASIAVNGLLIVNSGLIDPGYKGVLSLTIINMGKEPYSLEIEHPIFSTQWFELGSDNEVKADWSARRHGAEGKGVTPSQYSKLSRDFLEVDRRAMKVALRSSGALAAIAIIIAAGLSAFFSSDSEMGKAITTLRIDNVRISEKLKSIDLEHFQEILIEYEDIKNRLAALEKPAAD